MSNEAKSVQLLVLHPKSMESAVIVRTMADNESAIEERMGLEPRSLRIEYARDVYAAHFQRLGGWMSWVRWVGAGMIEAPKGPGANPFIDTKTPSFANYFVPDYTVGKATADIVTHALVAKRPVYFLEGDQVRRATRVVKTSGDMIDGYELRF